MTINDRVIRLAAEADAEAVSNVVAVTVRESNARDYSRDIVEMVVADSAPEHMQAMIRDGDFFIAEGNGGIVGVAGLIEGTLRRCFVLPAVQGKGIGRELLSAIERTAFRKGLSVLRVNSSLTATGFYERLGFVSEGEDSHNGTRFVKMNKVLPVDNVS
jgi:GNAT superfamily N-acetyltransferase